MRYIDALAALQSDPVAFVEKFFGATPDKWQAEVMQAVASGARGVSIKSGHGVGKTTILSWLAIWWVSVFYDSKVAITAPSSGQLNDALLPEMKRWIRDMPGELPDLYNVKSDRIEFNPFPELNFISAKTSRAELPDAMQGVHALNVLLIGDEASGIPEQVYESSGGSMSAEHACMLLAGNPVRPSGYFFDTFGRMSERWKTFTVNCMDSSRVSKEYIEEAKLRYGEDSNAFRVRVLGEFPRGDDDTVIPLHLVTAAAEREVHPVGTMVWGLDVARFGDAKTVLCKRRGNVVTEPTKAWAGLDTMEIAGRVHHEYEITRDDLRPEDILVDSVGVGGGVADRLRQLGLPARDINTGESPSMKGNFINLRSELWYKGREWFSGLDVALPPTDRVLQDELSTLRYSFSPSNKVRVETKDEVKKRGIKSPDTADAFILTFASNAVTAQRGRKFSRAKSIKRGIKGVV